MVLRASGASQCHSECLVSARSAPEGSLFSSLTSPKMTSKNGDKKGKPRLKGYIPPAKRQSIAPDCHDAHGLAYAVPTKLVVILKKEDVTKRYLKN